jgi:DHA1 family bicyclomycin/chloramphenicol resistance-like MFS transporter
LSVIQLYRGCGHRAIIGHDRYASCLPNGVSDELGLLPSMMDKLVCHPHRKMTEKRVSLVGGLLVMLGPVGMSLYAPAMPEIAHAFATSESAVKLGLSCYFGGLAVAQLVCGPLADAYGRRRVVIAFLLFYLLATILVLIAPSIQFLVGGRFLQGCGASAGLVIVRAVVRDLFVDEQSTRVLNFVSLVLALGPSISLAIGGFAVEYGTWRAPFVLMLVLGATILAVAYFALSETFDASHSRIRIRSVLHSYSILLRDRNFILSALVVASSIGAFYTQAAVLPFILMTDLRLTPGTFGLAMLMQSGVYLVGALVARRLAPLVGARRLMSVGLVFVASGSVLLALLLSWDDPGFLNVMFPVSAYAFGIAFVIPPMVTAALANYPHMAAAASAMTGFIQTMAGSIGGTIAAMFADPIIALATLIPLMGLSAIICWLAWKRGLPEPEVRWSDPSA